MPKKKNLVILHAHDMGRYNSAYDHDMPTPAIRRFSEESLCLRNAHCAAPTCSPSRAALFTGKTAHQANMFGLVHRGWALKDPQRHLASWLGKFGYRTVLSGIQHEIHPEENQMPYHTVLETSPRDAWTRDIHATDLACDWLRREGKSESESPFFLCLGLFMPHVPFISADPKRFPESAMKVPPPLPDSVEVRKDIADYKQSVERADQCFGLLLDALRYQGLEEDTVVLMTTDHGIAFPKMKCNLTGHGTGVTVILRDPERPLTHARFSDRLVSHLDVYPTICEALGIEKPNWLIGNSFLPLFDDGNTVIREDSFSEVNYHASYQPTRSVRTERYNLIVSFDDDMRRPLANCDHSRTKELLMKEGWGEVPLNQYELYDLEEDPHELTNLAGKNEYKAIEDEMKKRLELWMQQTNDPLLERPIPLRPGARSNPREHISPSQKID